jgi:hypothetical protein
MRVLKLVPWLFAVVAVAVAAVLLRVEQVVGAEPPAVIERIREVQRLEVLEVTVHKKVTFAPDPKPQPTLLAGVWAYARDTVAPKRGTALVFANARFFVDLRKLKGEQVYVRGEEVTLELPEPEIEARVLPGETEVIVSNLGSEDTAAMLQAAEGELHASVLRDVKLRDRARESAERTLTALLKGLGFRKVTFRTTPSSKSTIVSSPKLPGAALHEMPPTISCAPGRGGPASSGGGGAVTPASSSGC